MDVKKLEYPAKILIAWAEAIGGNKQITEWLIRNGYIELGIFVYALKLDNDARKWLMDNGYAHLMALISAVERNKAAIEWLKKHNFTILEKIALAGDGDEESFQWLVNNNFRDFAYISKKIQFVKDEIEDRNNDPHYISFD